MASAIQRALKRAVNAIRGLPVFSGAGGSGYGPVRFLKSGSQYDWEQQAGPLETNSAVASCLRWVLTNFGEPELTVTRVAGKGHRDPIADHPLVMLANEPNPAMDRFDFWGWPALYSLIDGNGYAYKVRSRARRVVQLWPLHTYLMSPVYPRDGSRWLDGWKYRVNGQDWFIPVEDVIHFKWGVPDRYNDRLYVSPLKTAVREICTDNEILTLTAALGKNAGIPALAIIPNDPSQWLTIDQALDLKELYRENFTGDEAGGVFVPTGPVKLEKVGYSPAEMILDKLQRMPESRICATLGLPPQVVGLLVGESTSGLSNHGTAREQARKQAYEDCLIPLQKRFASALQRQLLPDMVSNPTSFQLLWDYSLVQCLADSEDAKHKRLRDDLAAGGIMRSEFKKGVGLPVTKDDEVYYIPKGATAVTGDHFPVVQQVELDEGGDEGPTDTEELGDNPAGEDPPNVTEDETDKSKSGDK